MVLHQFRQDAAALVGLLLLIPCVFSGHSASELPDAVLHNRIRVEGDKRSRIMEFATELIDGIGPRLTGSPNLERAMEWARRALLNIGCSNVHKESWGEFGMGWRERNVWVRMTRPDAAPLIARAAPWSPATPGPVSGELVAVRGFSDEREFDAYRGKLAGKIVLLGTAPSMPEAFPIDKPLLERLTERQLEEFAAQPFERATSYVDSQELEKDSARFELMERTGSFFAKENVAAVIVPSGNNPSGGVSGGTLYADTNYTFGWKVYQRAHSMRVPLVIVTVENYGRLSRLLQRRVSVKIELNVDTEFLGDHLEGFNLVADFPGVDPAHKDEIVMVSAHLDSWTAGTGATDDGAGVLIALEAMRILNAVEAQPRRTIRIALWTGEEQGSLGSREYVKRHIATVPFASRQVHPEVPEFLLPLAGPVSPKPDHARISASYNLDAGGGRVRGVSTSDPALVPIFEGWMKPLKDLGVTMVRSRGDCGGDCWSFAQVGIPTPSFKQDPLEYDTRSHHTNMDTYERLVPEDLRQAAIVVAITLYNTAMREQMLPRLPLYP